MHPSAVHTRAPKNLEYYQTVYDCREHGWYSVRVVWAFGKRKRNVICIASVNDIPVNIQIEFNVPPTEPNEAVHEIADAAVATAAIDWLMGAL